jgi:transaldolase
MALFLDSASIENAQRAVELGFVWGATTQPAYIAQAGRGAVDIIADLCALLPGTVFYQPTGPTLSRREAEALRMVGVDQVKVALMLPCTTENLALAASLTDEGITCGVTAVFSPYQAYLACEAGAHFVLPYVNRSTRLQGDGPRLVSALLDVIEAAGTGTELLALDIKTADEVVETVLAGAHHLSLPLDLILSLGEHPLSQQVIDEP